MRIVKTSRRPISMSAASTKRPAGGTAVMPWPRAVTSAPTPRLVILDSEEKKLSMIGTSIAHSINEPIMTMVQYRHRKAMTLLTMSAGNILPLTFTAVTLLGCNALYIALRI